MICKTFEVRDVGTCAPILAIKLEPSDERDRWLLSRAGFGKTPEQQGEYVLFINLNDAPYDPFGHKTRARTYPIAHAHIRDNFDTLENGAVVCVEFINGELPWPKRTEQGTVHGE